MKIELKPGISYKTTADYTTFVNYENNIHFKIKGKTNTLFRNAILDILLGEAKNELSNGEATRLSRYLENKGILLIIK